MTTGLRLRRVLSGAAVLFSTIALTATLPVAGAQESDDAAAAAVPIVRIDGRGHGHGVGMSQWGAYTMAAQGASSAQILGAFYPGTQLAQQGGGVVVVVDQRDHARIRFPGGGEVRSARDGGQQNGFPVKVGPGGVVDIVRVPEGYRVTSGSVSALDSTDPTPFSSSQEDCVVFCQEPEPDPEPEPCVVCGTTTTTTTAPPRPSPTPTPTQPKPQPAPQPSPTTAPPTTQAPSAPTSTTPVWAVSANGLVESVDRGRTYRGLFELTGPPGAMRVRNHLDIEDYLKGMAEVPSTWPQAAVEAQAVAARTYAMRAMAASGELCDSESCQVYVGIAHEKPGQTRAVDATRGVVVTYGGRLAATFYSASGGGFAANVQEGFGADYDVPYLPAHPYPNTNPDEWALDVALTDVAGRLGYPGTITGVRVDETGPSGRALQMTIVGDAGDSPIDPQDFRRRLGLRSTLFTVATTSSTDAPPPPPPPDDPGVVGSESADADQFAAVLGTRDVDRFEQAITAPAVDDLTDLASDPVTATFAFALAVLALGAVATSGTLAGYRRTLDAAAPAGLDRGPWFAPAMRMPDVVAATLERWTNRSR